MTRCLRWAEVAKAAWVPYQADTAGLEAKAERMEAWRVPFLAGMAGAKAGMVVVVAAAAAAMDTRHKCPYNTCACKQGCLCSPMPSQPRQCDPAAHHFGLLHALPGPSQSAHADATGAGGAGAASGTIST